MTIATEPTVKLTELATEDLKNMRDFYELHGSSQGFSEAHYDAIVAILMEREGETQKTAIDDLQTWAAAQVRKSPAKAVAMPEVKEEEPTAASIKDRPSSIDAIVGQKNLVNRLRMTTMGTTLRGVKMPHVLISGPAGYGKTTVANIIATELGLKMLTIIGNQVRRPADLTGLLVKFDGPCVLFVDEIHAMSKAAQEALYTALEDGFIDVIAGTGMDASAYRKDLPGLVVVGATTNPGKLTIPMRDRFGLQLVMDEYSEVDLGTMVSRGLNREGMPHDFGEAITVAQRSKGTPRCALRLAESVLNYAAVTGHEMLADGIASDALSIFGIQDNGLDETDIRILEALTGHFSGGAVGMDSLAQYLDIDTITLRDQYEPFLTRSGYLMRAKSGRQATDEAYKLMRSMGLLEDEDAA